MNIEIVKGAERAAGILVNKGYPNWKGKNKERNNNIELLLKGFYELCSDRKENLITIALFNKVIKRYDRLREELKETKKGEIELAKRLDYSESTVRSLEAELKEDKEIIKEIEREIDNSVLIERDYDYSPIGCLKP